MVCLCLSVSFSSLYFFFIVFLVHVIFVLKIALLDSCVLYVHSFGAERELNIHGKSTH